MKFSLKGSPNERQKEFFNCRAKYIAYGGARGGGKSWALRRKLILFAFRWPGSMLLLIRRSYPELYSNHIVPMRRELCGTPAAAEWSESRKQFRFRNGSVIQLGYLSNDGDVLRYQGSEYDVVAVDEATQITERQFDCLKACVRGTNNIPKRMYLTCNPGGVGHAWVKRLFVDRRYGDGEKPEDYQFVPAKAADNADLLRACPDYLDQLRSIRDPKLRRAWLDGDWNVFEGQFFAELDPAVHVIPPRDIASEGCSLCAGLDYGFDMLALIICAVRPDGAVYAVRELKIPNLTLSRAAEEVSAAIYDTECAYGLRVMSLAMPPDLWNRRQDTGRSGVEIMYSAGVRLPPLLRADARRVPGWMNLREYISGRTSAGEPKLRFFDCCPMIFADLSAMVYDRRSQSDAATEPHDITHAPDALRYLLMARPRAEEEGERVDGEAGYEMW